MERVVLGRREKTMIGFRWSGDELVTYDMESLEWQMEHLNDEYTIDND